MTQVDINYLEECAKEDFNLKNYLDSKVKKLPKKIKYSMGDDMYRKFYRKTFFSYMKNLFDNNPGLKLFLTKKDNECLGWVACEIDILRRHIFNIRFGSFYSGDSDLDRSKNLFFMQDLRKTFVNFFNNGISASFLSNKKNPFIKHYYRYVKEIGGEFRKSSRKYISFYISKPEKKEEENIKNSYSKEKAEELMECMKRPIPLEEAEKLLWEIYQDNTFSSLLRNCSNKEDVRFEIREAIKGLVNSVSNPELDLINNWDAETIEVLVKILEG